MKMTRNLRSLVMMMMHRSKSTFLSYFSHLTWFKKGAASNDKEIEKGSSSSSSQKLYYWLFKTALVSASGSICRSPKRSITTFSILPVNRAPGLYSSLTGVPVSIPISKPS